MFWWRLAYIISLLNAEPFVSSLRTLYLEIFFYLFFLLKFYLFERQNTKCVREETDGESSISWVTSQISTTAPAGLDWSQGPRIPTRSPMGMSGSQVLELFLFSFESSPVLPVSQWHYWLAYFFKRKSFIYIDWDSFCFRCPFCPIWLLRNPIFLQRNIFLLFCWQFK